MDVNALTHGGTNVLHGLRRSNVVADGIGDTTIDIVAMMFDYILDDPAIPDPMKALIDRLQIPLLKVALLDKEIFSEKSHPGRRLLNLMADAAIGWSETTVADDELYRTVEHTVQRVLNEFDADVGVIADIADELQRYLDTERGVAVQQADQLTESIRQREQHEKAQLLAFDVIRARLAKQPTSRFVADFLKSHWRNVLVLAFDEEGCAGQRWKTAERVMDELVWSIQPMADVAARKRLNDTLPRLIKGLKTGMAQIALAGETRREFMSRLANVHISAVSAAVRGAVRGAVRARDPDEDVTVPQNGPWLDDVATTAGVEEIEHANIEEIVLQDGNVLPDDEADEFVAMAMSMELGDWVEFSAEDGSCSRGRFTWISPATGCYLFTTRKGEKAAEMTLPGIAAAFRRGGAHRIEAPKDPLFERAIGNLVHRLPKGIRAETH